MTALDWLALAPHVALLAGALIIVLVVSFRRSHGGALAMTAAAFAIAFLALFPALEAAPREVTPLFVFDGYAAFFSGLFLIAGLATALLCRRYLEGRSRHQEECYILLALATLGAMSLASAQHFASLLLGMEIVSISLYALVAYPEDGHPPLEAALKYLVLSGVGSATMLFGMALIYHATGTMLFVETGAAFTAAGRAEAWLLAGQAILVAGIAFKLSLIPFHMWTPDVYQGAPAPIAGYLATVSKAAVFAVLLRLAWGAELLEGSAAFAIVAAMAVLSMVAGNLLALLQDSVKRILAYSSIAHAGYLMIGLLALAALADRAMAVETSLMFLAGYVAMTLTAFAVIAELSPAHRPADAGLAEPSPASQPSDAARVAEPLPASQPGNADQMTEPLPTSQLGNAAWVAEQPSPTFRPGDADLVAAYRGLFWRRPMLAAALAVALLSLAGIPLTAGFIAKFYLFAAGVEGALWGLIWALILGSAISIYYYLKIVFAMTERAEQGKPPATSILGTATAIILALAVIALGTYPTPLINAIRQIVAALQL